MRFVMAYVINEPFFINLEFHIDDDSSDLARTITFDVDFLKHFSYRKGSVVVDAELTFKKGALVAASSVAQTLVTAASSKSFALKVDTSSIAVTSET